MSFAVVGVGAIGKEGEIRRRHDGNVRKEPGRNIIAEKRGVCLRLCLQRRHMDPHGHKCAHRKEERKRKKTTQVQGKELSLS